MNSDEVVDVESCSTLSSDSLLGFLECYFIGLGLLLELDGRLPVSGDYAGQIFRIFLLHVLFEEAVDEVLLSILDVVLEGDDRRRLLQLLGLDPVGHGLELVDLLIHLEIPLTGGGGLQLCCNSCLLFSLELLLDLGELDPREVSQLPFHRGEEPVRDELVPDDDCLCL